VRRSAAVESESTDLGTLRDMVPFAVELGIELLEVTRDVVRARLEWAPERTTHASMMHGGAIMALADTCGGIAAFVNMPEGATGTATIESKTNFVRAVRSGWVTATTRALHRGRTLAVLETEVTRDDGKLAAKVAQTQIYHYPDPAR
jgi:1,4-dihydroxy-2-naphthoyl-CoA hydrolase